jgi:hypothetical protein
MQSPRTTVAAPATRSILSVVSGLQDQARRRATCLRLSLEALEDRTLLTAFAQAGPPAQMALVGGTPGGTAAADFNGDGNLDVAVVNEADRRASVFLGNGDGSFRTPHLASAASNSVALIATHTTGMTVTDLNGDGNLDVVVANKGANEVFILFGRGLDAGYALTPGPRLRAGTGPVSTTVADVTGDGVLDLLVANSGSRDVTVLEGLGGGFFNEQAARALRVGRDLRQVVAGDFDRDGRTDLVIVNVEPNDLTFISDVVGEVSRIGPRSDVALKTLLAGFDDGSRYPVAVDNNPPGTMFAGGKADLSVGDVESPGAAPSTALAGSTLLGGQREIDDTSSSGASAAQFPQHLPVQLRGELPMLLVNGGPDSGANRPQGVSLKPLAASSVPVVATLGVTSPPAAPPVDAQAEPAAPRGSPTADPSGAEADGAVALPFLLDWLGRTWRALCERDERRRARRSP